MRAAVLHAYDEPLVIEELGSPKLGDHEVRLRIDASGVCRSDLSVMHGGLPLPPPIILGHEGTGVVTEVGPSVSRVKPGDRVIASFTATCGDCWYCRHDLSNMCEATSASSMLPRGIRLDGSPVIGMIGLGTFTDEMTLNELQAIPVQTELPPEQLALIGCGVTTGVGAALNTAKVTPGASVAVIGCGGVGQAVIQGARICGAARIFAIDPVALKREAARDNGATDFVDPAAGDPVQAVMDATGGRGADFVFEVLGSPETINQAFRTARRGGTIVVVGMPRVDAMVTMPAFPLFSEEKKLCGCAYGTSQNRRDFQRYIDLAECGRLDVASMVSRRIGLDDVNDAFRAMEAGEVIRSVIY